MSLSAGLPMNVGPQQVQPQPQPGAAQPPMQARPNHDKLTQILMHLDQASPEQRNLMLQKMNPEAQQSLLQKLHMYQIQKQQFEKQRQMSMMSQPQSEGMLDMMGASGMPGGAKQPQAGQGQQPPQQHQMGQPGHQELSGQPQPAQQAQGMQPGAGAGGGLGMGMGLQRQQFPVQQQQPPPGVMEQNPLFPWQP